MSGISCASFSVQSRFVSQDTGKSGAAKRRTMR